MTFRIYRLPGSREVWHIDNGCTKNVINVTEYESFAPTRSVDIGGNNVPRAWIEIESEDLYLINGKAYFGVRSIFDFEQAEHRKQVKE